MTRRIAFYTKIMMMLAVCPGLANTASARSAGQDSPAAIEQAMQRAARLTAAGHHFTAAALYFNAYTAEGRHQSTALGLLTESLIRSRLPNAASYFFIKTLQSGDRAAIRRVLEYLPLMMEAVGGDLLRKYIVQGTTEADYAGDTKNHFYYFVGKDDLLKGSPAKALQALDKVTSGSGILPQAAYSRGAALSMLGRHRDAITAFEACRRMAGRAESKTKALREEYFDLEARCTAGLARAHYQAGDHEKAEEIYDEIPKASFVWTDILFEQAWNAYARGDYNRALGKLVTYRSPSLSFVFNPEVDVLRAQSFLAMCHYDDVNNTVNDFNRRYANVGSQMKRFLLSHDKNLAAFYGLAKEVHARKLHTSDMLHRALNRFIRGPYFASLMAQENATNVERQWARAYAAQVKSQRFGAFLEKVIDWRRKTVQLLGGMFVRNFMTDLYQDLLSNLDRMSFIKLEMLKHSKTILQRKQVMSEDEDGVLKRGSADVARRDYQYFWTFNGEFWADELGDYVFALESQCGS